MNAFLYLFIYYKTHTHSTHKMKKVIKTQKANPFIKYELHSLTYKVLTTSQPDYLYNLISVQSTCTSRTHSSSAVTLARPSVSSLLQITNRSFWYASPYLWNQLFSSLLLSIYLIQYSVHSPPVLVHLILCVSPHHSFHLHSHHLSLPEHFNPDLKLICFTNPFLHSLLGSIWTAFMHT